MTWKDLSVFQFQQLSELWTADAPKDPIDLAADMVAICYCLGPQEVDSLPVSVFNDLCRGLDFLKQLPQWEPVKSVRVNGRRYRFVYDVRQIHAARYMEVKQFGAQGLVAAMHTVAASMVVPQRRTWWGRWVDAEYKAADHSHYAEDLQAAPITAVHGSAVFFWKVWQHSIAASADYLTQDLPAMKRETARRLLLDLSSSSDGSTTLRSLPSTSGSLLSRRIASRLSSSSMPSPISRRAGRMKKSS